MSTTPTPVLRGTLALFTYGEEFPSTHFRRVGIVANVSRMDVPHPLEGKPVCIMPAAQFDAMVSALNEIASWGEGDKVGSDFDEPNAARIARYILAKHAAGGAKR